MYQRRSFTWEDIEVRKDGDSPVLTGYAAVFEKLSVDLGGFRERIQRGAFAKTIKDGDIRALFNHDPNFVLARTRNNTLSLMEDDRGLRVSITPPTTTWAQDLVSSIERRDIDQMSFGFRVRRDSGEQVDTDEDGNLIRTLKEVQLLDVSPVTFPAYPQTRISARNMQLGQIFEQLEAGEEIGDLERRLLSNSLDEVQRRLGVSAPADNSHPENDAPADNSHPSEPEDGLERRLRSLNQRLRLAEAA